MLKAMKAGLIAATGLFVTSVGLSVGLMALDWSGVLKRQIPDGQEAFCEYYALLLIPCYLVLAAGFAIWTSDRVMVAARQLKRTMPKDERERIAALFGIPAVLIWGLALRPAESVLQMAQTFSGECVARLLWALTMTICASVLGGIANSAISAGRLP
jgi:hypothetical protein